MGWQADLDRMFPYGAMVTVLKSVTEYTADAPTFLTPRLVVEEEAEQPTVTCILVESEKGFSFTLTKVEGITPGTWLVHTPNRGLLLSTNVDAQVKEALTQVRHEWYGTDV